MKSGNLHDDEITKRIQGLSIAQKENSFKVPDGYFESLPDNIMQKIEALPDLQKLKNANPYQVPDGYFDALPAVIQQRIIDDNKKKSYFGEWRSISLRPKYAIVAAVVLILLIFGIKYITNPSFLHSPEKMISLEELQNAAYLAELDEATIIEVLEQQNNNQTTNEEDNDIEQYLIDNNIDVSQIENHL